MALDFLTKDWPARNVNSFVPRGSSAAMIAPEPRPFCLILGHKAPHSFYIPEPKYSNAFDEVKIEYPASAFHLDDKPQWVMQRLTTWHGIYGPLFEWRKNFPDARPEAVKDFAAMTRAYWGTILSVDDSVGRIYSALRDFRQLDNTLFIFTSDNGLLNGEHGMVDKRTMHEPSIRVPLLVRWPGHVPSHARFATPVSIADIPATVIDLLKAPPTAAMPGQSLALAWTNPAAAADSTRYPVQELAHMPFDEFNWVPAFKGAMRSVTTSAWHYIEHDTLGAELENTVPLLPSAHWLGMRLAFCTYASQSGIGAAGPTQLIC